MSYRPADLSARERALDITHSFCVQAPAGSGKTELLTQRLLKLLAHVQQPEEVLAFTFTRKAAAEMRDRLLRSLQEAETLRQQPAEALQQLEPHKLHTLQLATAVLEQDERHGWHLLLNSQRLRLTTIDGFTAWLSAQLPLSANLGARAVITTDMEPVFAEAIHNTLAMLETPGGVSVALQQLLPHLQNNLQTAEKLLQKLLYQRDQWLPLVKALEQEAAGARAMMEATLQDMIEQQLHDTAALLDPFRNDLLALIAFAAGNLREQPDHELHQLNDGADLPPTYADAVEGWRMLSRFLLVKGFEGFRKPKGLRAEQGFPSQKEAKGKEQQETFKAMKEVFGNLCEALDASGCLPALQMVARLPDPHYPASQWEVLNALCTLLPVLAAQLNVAMQGNGVVDHTETSLAALRALGDADEPTDLALRLDYRIRHILVDEFQDTSSMQFHLLEKLTLGWQAGDGRTLFIVGDGMQSCYAFRNAKVSLFLKARNEGIGSVQLLPVDLEVNFRSDSSVVHWVNTVFNASFPRIDDLARGGVRYSRSTARAEQAQTAGVHVQLWLEAEDTTTDSGTRRQLEATHIALLCQQLQAEDPMQSIAVLVRSRSHLRELVPALRALGLRWNASKIDRLLSYPDIRDLFTLLRALLSIADSTAWLALLRTPFFGLTLNDLHVLASDSRSKQQSLWSILQQHEALAALSSDARSRLQRCVPLLQQARQRRQQQPLRQVLESAWIALGGPACLADVALLSNVASFLALVEQHTQHGDIVDIHALEEALNETYGSAVDDSVKLQLMTIHNAKGLEFDVVLLPALDRTPKANSKELLMWHEHLDSDNRSRPLLGLLPEKGQSDDALYDYLRFEHEQRDALESTRLLYIAVTRAAKAAWLFGTVKTGKTGLKAASSSLLQQILPALDAQQSALQVTLTPLPGAAPTSTAPVFEHKATQPLRRLPGHWQPLLAQSLWPPAATAVDDDPLHQQLLARSIGELVHAGLKLCVERGTDWFERAGTPPLWKRTLAPLCAHQTALDAALQSVHTQLQKCMDSTAQHWLFHDKQHQDACELALVDYSRGYRRDCVIDRTFVDHHGERWIIDYKTAAPADQQPLTEFLTDQTLRYQSQLENYRNLLAIADPATAGRCKTALYFTALDLLHELPPAAK